MTMSITWGMSVFDIHNILEDNSAAVKQKQLFCGGKCLQNSLKVSLYFITM
jgi:hypothetical protein